MLRGRLLAASAVISLAVMARVVERVAVAVMVSGEVVRCGEYQYQSM